MFSMKLRIKRHSSAKRRHAVHRTVCKRRAQRSRRVNSRSSDSEMSREASRQVPPSNGRLGSVLKLFLHVRFGTNSFLSIV